MHIDKLCKPRFVAKNFDHATPDFFMHRFGIIYFHLLSPEKITGRNSAISLERQTGFLNKKNIGGAPPHSVHPGLQLPRRDLVRLDDVDDGAPPRTGVAIERVGERLGGRLEDLLGVHVFGPQSLAHAWKYEMILGV